MSVLAGGRAGIVLARAYREHSLRDPAVSNESRYVLWILVCVVTYSAASHYAICENNSEDVGERVAPCAPLGGRQRIRRETRPPCARVVGVRGGGESLLGPLLARAASRTELRRTPAPVPARARGCGRSAEAGAFGRGGRAHARSRRLLRALPACVGNHGLCASTHV